MLLSVSFEPVEFTVAGWNDSKACGPSLSALFFAPRNIYMIGHALQLEQKQHRTCAGSSW
jgi:hypothetical protein